MKLKGKCKTIKLQKVNIHKSQDSLGYGNAFLETMNAEFMKEIIDNLDFIKIKNFCHSKDNVRETEDKTYAEKNFQKTHLIKYYYLKYREFLKPNNISIEGMSQHP